MNIKRVKPITLIFQLIILANLMEGKKWEQILINPLITFHLKNDYKKSTGENLLKTLLILNKIKLNTYKFKTEIINDNFKVVILKKIGRNKLYIYCWQTNSINKNKDIVIINNKPIKIYQSVIDMYQKIVNYINNKKYSYQNIILVGYHKGSYPLQLLICMIKNINITNINYGSEIQNKLMIPIINKLNNVINLQVIVKDDKSINKNKIANKPIYFSNHNLKLHLPRNFCRICFHKKASISEYLYRLIAFFIILQTSFE